MASSFPTSIDAFPAPGAATPMNTPGTLEHDIQHANVNDAVSKIETYLGVTGSGVVSTITNKLAVVTAQAASNASTIATLSASISGFAVSITSLQASNPSGAADGEVFIDATATAGTEINAAIASFGSTKGVVRLGKGTFTLDVQVVLTGGITIRGSGADSTFLVFNPASFSPAITAGTTPISRVDLEDFRVQSTTSGAGVAIDLGYVNYGKVDRVNIGTTAASPLKGIDFSINNNSSRPYYNKVTNCLIVVAGASPIGIDCSNQANSNVFDNIRVQIIDAVTGTPVGIKVGGSTRPSHTTLISHLDCESAATMTGIWFTDGAYSALVLDCYFESINIGIQIDSGSRAIRGLGCYFYNMGTANVQDGAGSDIAIAGASVDQSSPTGTEWGYSYRSATAPIVYTSGVTALTRTQVQGAHSLRVKVLGGGGAGGGAATNVAGSATVGGGGQAGHYAEGIIPITSITFPINVTVGAGGAGNSGATGNAGVASSFGTLISCSGGNAGASIATQTTLGIANGGLGIGTITGTFAQITGNGNEGFSGVRYSGTQAWPGQGAGSNLGGSVIPSGTVTGATGRNGVANTGSGGSGAMAIGATGPFAGGAGGSGIVIVELIF